MTTTTRPLPCRFHGTLPYTIAAIHGGPGARGEMEPVARALATRWGVLEPMQSATTFDGQVQELAGIVERHGHVPATLVGFSWGAWLAFVTAATRPDLVKKLVLVGSGPFEDSYVARIAATRAQRLGNEGSKEFTTIIAALTSQAGGSKHAALERLGFTDPTGAWRRLGKLASKVDAFDPVEDEGDPPWLDAPESTDPGMSFASLVDEASTMRREGTLLELGKKITCPVIAIHGDHDPHPAEGVRDPLQHVLRKFEFILLERCGHKPWIERHARDAFFTTLRGACEP